MDVLMGVDINGLDRLELVKTLWRHSCLHPIYLLLKGSTVFQEELPGDSILRDYCVCSDWEFDCLFGRVIRCRLSAEAVDGSAYDAFLGVGMFEEVVGECRRRQEETERVREELEDLDVSVFDEDEMGS